MATSLVPTHALWQPSAKHNSSPVSQPSDALWCRTSCLSSPAPKTPAQSNLWKKPKPAAPVKPDSLRAPGLWRSTSFSPDSSPKITHSHNKRWSRSLTRSVSPVPQDRCDRSSNSSWIDNVLPSYVGRSHHYRNSHSVWAEHMFQQRRQSVEQVSSNPATTTTGSYIDSVLPSGVSSGPYKTDHAVWAERMFQQRRQIPSRISYTTNLLPPGVSSGPYKTDHAIWAERMLQLRQQFSSEASYITNILPPGVSSGPYQFDIELWSDRIREYRLRTASKCSYITAILPPGVTAGPYRTDYAVWEDKMSQRAVRSTESWIDSLLPSYVKSGSYQTSHAVWREQAPRNGLDVSYIDDMLPSYVTRSSDYRTSHSLWEESVALSKQSFDILTRSHSTPSMPNSPLVNGTNSPPSSASSFRIHQPTSFLHHRNTSQSWDHDLKALPRTVAFHPPDNLARTGSSMTANEEPAPIASLLSPPTRQQAINSLRTPASARFAQLQSPCLFHKRFDDAVNLGRVLEEIEAEEGLTSGRLMQTATSVREISKQLQRKPIKRAVRSIMIVTKARDNSLVYLTRDLALWLLSTPRYGKDVGVNVYVDAKLKNSKRFNAESIVAQNPAFATMLRYWDPDLCYSSPEKFDLVLTLGGDGTVLFTSFALFQRVVPPVLAFGLGSLGFLTPFNFNNYKTSLDKVMGNDGMRVNLRMRFTCTVFRAPTYDTPRSAKARKALPSPVDTAAMVEGEQFEVLNELVIDRGPSPYVSNLELYADDSLLTVVQADGCIFSTPTGSTAYSLSAGGPLTDPSIPGLVLTPICPHTLSFRPMVLSDQLCLKVCIPRDSRSTAYASFDGKHRVELRRGDCVRVEAGRYPFPTVTGDEGAGNEWFNSVRRALRWNTRGAMQKAFSSGASSVKAPDNGRFEDGILNELAHASIPTVPEEDDEDDEDEPEAEEEAWDIDFAPIDSEVRESAGVSVVDSGLGLSESGSHCASPIKKAGTDMINANNGRGASLEEIVHRIRPAAS